MWGGDERYGSIFSYMDFASRLDIAILCPTGEIGLTSGRRRCFRLVRFV